MAVVGILPHQLLAWGQAPQLPQIGAAMAKVWEPQKLVSGSKQPLSSAQRLLQGMVQSISSSFWGAGIDTMGSLKINRLEQWFPNSVLQCLKGSMLPSQRWGRMSPVTPPTGSPWHHCLTISNMAAPKSCRHVRFGCPPSCILWEFTRSEMVAPGRTKKLRFQGTMTPVTLRTTDLEPR